MALLPYPAAFPQEALLMMLDKFRGKEVSTPDLVNAAWNVAGYGLAQSIGGGAMVANDVPEGVSDADLIATALRQNGVNVDGENTTSFTFIPWVLIVSTAIKLIVKLAL
jgi:hypothetical protein